MSGSEYKINLDVFIKKHLTLSNFLNERKIEYSVDELNELINRAGLLLQSEPNLPRMSPTVVIVGDIHGQYFDLLRMFSMFRTESKSGTESTKYMFLGDYVDRGTRSLEVVCLCLALKLRFPSQYTLLRGNHETIEINHVYGFHCEMIRRYPQDGEELWQRINELFCFFPLAGVIGGKILCMHGGISKGLNQLADIEKLPRPLYEPRLFPLAMDLLWADPMARLSGFAPNTIRGVSTFFGEDSVSEMCCKLKIELIVRAHQMQQSGYGFFANKKMITVFSAPRYQADAVQPNKGAVVVVNKDGRVHFMVLEPEGGVGQVAHGAKKSISRKQSFGPDVRAKKTKEPKKPTI